MPNTPHRSPRRHTIHLDGRCPHCHAAYDFRRLRVLAEREPQVVAYIDCKECGVAMLSVLTVSPQGMTAVGLQTDLLSEEIVPWTQRAAVSPDDVLAFHSWIEAEARPVHFLPH